ncbi:DUF938 domain-containing protein [Porticoccaceae bacterium LTM1]|nr:DUF938 domain-containing protein [Porticoccaceae bacterium LTM1]
MTVIKPFSQACENNKAPILDILKTAFESSTSVLEIGSGTGQHAVHFAPALSHLQWYTSDRSENHAGINFWLNEMPADNLHRPILLDVDMPEWPELSIDGVFTANTCHIMPWHSVETMFSGVGRLLSAGGIFCLYGPFNYGGNFTSDSNASFDMSLKLEAPHMGIRDFEAIEQLAFDNGFALKADKHMPANNRLLVFGK